MEVQQLVDTIREKASFLCVGLDPDPARIPAHLGQGPEAVLRFNKAIIDATSDLAVAYKPNVAFYEAMGADGWAVLSETMAVQCVTSPCHFHGASHVAMQMAHGLCTMGIAHNRIEDLL